MYNVQLWLMLNSGDHICQLTMDGGQFTKGYRQWASMGKNEHWQRYLSIDKRKWTIQNKQ